jgi:hypothetical protein
MPHLAGYKEMEITGHDIGIVGSMVHNLPAVSVNSIKSSDFNLFGPLRSMWLACDVQEKTVEARSPPGYSHCMPVSFMVEYEPCCNSGTNV